MKTIKLFRLSPLTLAAAITAAALLSCAGSARPSSAGTTGKADDAKITVEAAPAYGTSSADKAPPPAPELKARDKTAVEKMPREKETGLAAAAAPRPEAMVPPKDKGALKGETAKPGELKFLEDRSAPAPARGSAGTPAPSREPSESGLKAGWSDDNAQYNLFLDFLNKNASAWPFRMVPAEGRILAKIVDEAGKGVPNARIAVKDSSGKVRETLTSYSDGAVLLTPEKGASGTWRLEADSAAGKESISFDPAGPRNIQLRLDKARRLPSPVPLDIVFVMDTTGSMGEEIERLKSTVDIIRDNLDLASPRPRLRFGLVLYRDKGDQYVARPYPLTENQGEFRGSLSTANADGGGDDPEDLESALDAAVGPDMGWNPDGARLIFVITDAPAQAYPQAIGYDVSADKARAAAIKIHTIGTGGLPIAGEYQLRQIAQRTRGRYIFLTYGERGESEGGAAGAVSHHTGSNWNADRLETIIIRFAKEELALLGAEGTRTPDEDYFQAKAAGTRPKDAILDELFSETVRRLVDYSSAPVVADTPAAVLPAAAAGTSANADAGLVDVALKKNAEYFGMRFLQAAAASKRFRIVERADLQAILAEWELRLSAAGDGSNAVKLGELLGAEVLLAPSLVRLSAEGGGEWEFSVRLIRVKTGEILSISRARIAGDLGL